MATGAKQRATRHRVAIRAGPIAAGVLACAIAAGYARAQDALDTEYTPVAKPSELWTPIGGAEFGAGGALHDGSPTPYTADFFGVDFLGRDDGFFAGAACEDPGAPFGRLDECERVPVIYRYSDGPGAPPLIEEAYRGVGQGFVGAVAWIGPGQALAVGGDGDYPRREFGREGRETDAEYAERDERKGAGRARAWLYSGGSWRELEDEELPVGMRALTALDCAPQPADHCVAGGLQQLWHWRDGVFESDVYSSASPSPKFENAGEFRFRVRQIRFTPDTQAQPGLPKAYAVTSGCCGALGEGMVSRSGPRLLVYADGRWSTQVLSSYQKATGGETTRRAFPDSYYSIVPSVLPDGSVRLSVATSPGGPIPEQDGHTRDLGEPGSLVLSDLVNVPVDPGIRELRLIAADGDFASPAASTLQPFLAESGATTNPPDGLLDWAVGSLRASGQGAAFTTLVARDRTQNPTGCTARGVAFDRRLCEQRALESARDPEPSVEETRSRRVFKLPTYALNAFTFDGAVGWAAGDRGAIVRLGGSGRVGTEPEANLPSFGNRERAALPDGSAFASARPQPAAVETGAVPALATQPPEELDQPALVPAGTPDPAPSRSAPDEVVSSVVMSRDGSRGWALGSSAGSGGMTLYRYGGGRWARCDADGVPGLIEPDPACASLAPLLHYEQDGRPAPVSLSLAARVPYENDADPTNDDDFELVALGGRYQPSGSKYEDDTVMRYGPEGWEVDAAAMDEIKVATDTVTGIAFTASDDGWIMGDIGRPAIYRFNGWQWTDCARDRLACGDTEGLLPLEKGPAARNLDLSVAGGQLYLGGTRLATAKNTQVKTEGTRSEATGYPMILRRDTATGRWEAAYDPGCASRPAAGECVPSTDPATRGEISSIAVAELPDGRQAGWAVGRFGAGPAGSEPGEGDATGLGGSAETALLRLDPGSREWAPWRVDDAAADYLLDEGIGSAGAGPRLITVPGTEAAFIVPADRDGRPRHPLLAFDPERERWSVLPTPFLSSARDGTAPMEATVSAFAPDGQGGLWLAARQTTGPTTFFYRYTSRAPRAVFEEAPHPIREPITDMAGGADGSVWVTTDSGVLYHYDRVTGWGRARIPGWDPGPVVTSPSRANAVAVAPGGEGLAVGEQGRIAALGPAGAILDRAAGVLCGAPVVPPCGTAHDLHAVAVAPDGSAIAGGDGLSLLWRPASGELRAIERPPADPRTTVTGISMPTPQGAWLATSGGEVFAGRLEGDGWSWRSEARDAQGRLLTREADGGEPALRDIALDAEGEGYAVGERGVVLQRSGDGEEPWRRLDTGFTDELWSVALPANGQGDGALIGGGLGLVLTVVDGQVAVARPSDYFDPLTASSGNALAARIVGVALLPGYEPGQVEAWAASQVPAVPGSRRPAPGALLHYTSAPQEPLLNPAGRARPLPDAPGPTSDTLSFAAFGRSECRSGAACPEAHGANLANERVMQEIADRALADAAGLDFALFTGDIANAAGRDSSSERTVAAGAGGPSSPLDPNIAQRRWAELVADAGVPLFGAIGGRDLSQAKGCLAFTGCFGDRDLAGGAGLNLPWREAMSGMPAPWGSGEPAETGALRFEPVPAGAPEGAGGGARTHYAVDIMDAERDRKLARLIVLDSSLRSLAASDPGQNPAEGQAAWLESVLCVGGSGGGAGGCTREPGQRAIVLTNTPTYSYARQIAPAETAADAAALEATLLRHDADVAIAGRLGWNGLYWALAPGLHHPAPGGEHPDPARPPAPPAAAGGEPLGDAPAGSLPFVVASGAGGGFGPDGNAAGMASEGFWHGYSVVRLDTRSGEVRVEQRPVFDWIGLSAAEHTVRPGQTLALEGFGREPAGMDAPLRYDEIESHAVTHRYDLLEADPQRPWLPRLATGMDGGGCAPYVCLSPQVATVDPVSGTVRAGGGGHPPAYAVATLSVSGQAATWPLAFPSNAGFHASAQAAVQPGATVPAPGLSAPPPGAQAPSAGMTLNPPGSPPLPAPPPPSLPASFAEEPPPAMPPLPPPPAVKGSAPAQLQTASEIPVPPVRLMPPPPPLLNVASPAGARRSDPQRQAALKRLEVEADSGIEGEALDPTEAYGLQDDFATPNQAATRREAPGRSAASRRDRTRPAPSFTPLARPDQPSAWTQGALYGGGISLLALVAALGWARARPTPRHSPARIGERWR